MIGSLVEGEKTRKGDTFPKVKGCLIILSPPPVSFIVFSIEADLFHHTFLSRPAEFCVSWRMCGCLAGATAPMWVSGLLGTLTDISVWTGAPQATCLTCLTVSRRRVPSATSDTVDGPPRVRRRRHISVEEDYRDRRERRVHVFINSTGSCEL